jgi:excisionase family DNA binding protein
MRHVDAISPPPTTYTREQAASYLGLTKWKLTDLCRRGIVPHLRLGRRLLFRKASLDAVLDRLESESVLPALSDEAQMTAALRGEKIGGNR